MTAAPGHVNELVEQIMERLHSATLDGPSGDGDASPTLTEVLHVREGCRAEGQGLRAGMGLGFCQARSREDPSLRELRSITKALMYPSSVPCHLSLISSHFDALGSPVCCQDLEENAGDLVMPGMDPHVGTADGTAAEVRTASFASLWCGMLLACGGIGITSYPALFMPRHRARKTHNQPLQSIYKADSIPGDAEVAPASSLDLALDGPHGWPRQWAGRILCCNPNRKPHPQPYF